MIILKFLSILKRWFFENKPTLLHLLPTVMTLYYWLLYTRWNYLFDKICECRCWYRVSKFFFFCKSVSSNHFFIRKYVLQVLHASFYWPCFFTEIAQWQMVKTALCPLTDDLKLFCLNFLSSFNRILWKCRKKSLKKVPLLHNDKDDLYWINHRRLISVLTKHDALEVNARDYLDLQTELVLRWNIDINHFFHTFWLPLMKQS